MHGETNVALEDQLFDVVSDALIILSNVSEGDFDLRVPIPENLGGPVEALFEGLNEMIISLGSEKTRSDDYRKDLEEKLATIEAQRMAIAELSTPIMEVWEGVLCLPVVGVIDTARSAEMTNSLLRMVVEKETRCCIVDITGIEVMDTSTADHFMRMARAVSLLGAECVLTGINPHIAQTIVHMGMDLRGVRTHRTLQDALRYHVARGRSEGGQRVAGTATTATSGG
jgi:rsbT co-antagonist protein RsbR